MLNIPCEINHSHIEHSMLDLGSSINIIPLSIYKELNLGPLKKTKVVMQLADMSNVLPEGAQEDIVVAVNDLMFPADFFILDMGKISARNSIILLGRPFMITARTNIDIHNETLTCEFDGKVATFSLTKAAKFYQDPESVATMDDFEPLVREHRIREVVKDTLDWAIQTGKSTQDAQSEIEQVQEEIMKLDQLKQATKQVLTATLPPLQGYNKMFPSIIKVSKLQIKQLPEHLKYTNLGEGGTFPVIISSKLTKSEEHMLIALLKNYKELIGWTLADIKRISPSIVMYRIELDDEAKPVRDHQRK